MAGKAILAEIANTGALAHRVNAPGAALEERLAAVSIATFLENISGAVIRVHPGEGMFEALAASVRRGAMEQADVR